MPPADESAYGGPLGDASGGPRSMPPAGAGGMVEALERWLQSPLGASQCCHITGTVPIFDAIGMCAELRELSDDSVARLADAVGAGPPEGPVAVVSSATGPAVRLRSLPERVRAAAERHVLEAPGGSVSLLDLLEVGALASVLCGVPGAAERLEVLRQALGASERVEVSGSRALVRGRAPAGGLPKGAPPRSLPIDVVPGVVQDAGLAADALHGDGEPDADGGAATPESAFRTPRSLGSEPGVPGSPPCAPGGAQGCGASPDELGAEAAAAAAGTLQLEHASCWPGAEDQQFVPMCGGVGGQWLWLPLVLPVEASPQTAAAAAEQTGAGDAQDMFFPGARGGEAAGAEGHAADGDDVFPPGLPIQLGPRHDGSGAEAAEASSRSNSCGPSDGPPPHEATAGAPAARPRPGLGAPPEPPAPCTAFAGVPGEGQWVWFPAADADAFEPAWGWEDGQWPQARPRKLKARAKPWFPDRFAKAVSAALTTLENPPRHLANRMGPDGSVSIDALFSADPWLSEWCWHNPAHLIKSIKRTPESHQFITFDRDKLTVRALSWAERVRVLCEDYMLERQKQVAGPAPISELFQHPPVQSHVAWMGAGAAASSDSEYANTTGPVVQALTESTMLVLFMEESGDHSVMLLPPSEPLRTVVKPLLESDAKLISLLRSEGELSLACLAGHPCVQRMLERLQVGDTHFVLSSLRAAVEQLEGVEFDSSGMSFSLPAATPNVGQKALGKRRDDKSRWHPEEKDVKKLRDHFSFYFDEFNVQHNKVLMARIEAIRDKEARRTGDPRSGGHRPFFRLSDVSALPRIEAILSRYDQDAVGWLLEAVCQAKGRMPVRLAWSDRSRPVLELAYAPRFRYFEFVRRGPDTEFLLSPDANPTEASGGHPLHVVCMVSYSVSSDLSHSQSPKATDIQEQIMSGDSDPNMLAWEERQKKLVRQLKLYNPDVICLQGVQSVGFKERNSEADPEWFTCDDEPANNHLVHLYRDMSTLNYGLVFAPVMQMPSSSALCLGNAVLWKRNRWHMDTFSPVHRTAVVAVLKSKSGGPPLAACSYKPPVVWAQDWNERIPASELFLPAARAQNALAAAAAEHGARPLWCGDFALEPRELLPQLSAEAAAAPAGGAAPAWRSACQSVMGSSPWTSTVKHSEGKATDLILHDRSLRALAVLGGLRESMGMLEFLKAGNPSDHLLQVAAFSCAEGGDDHAALDGGGRA